MGRSSLAAALVTAALAVATPAAATPGVVVVPAVNAPVAADDTARAVAGALATVTGQVPVLDALAAARRARAAGAVPAGRLAGFARATQRAAEGWRAYLAVDGERAAVWLGEARAEAEALLDLDGGLELYADVELRRGLVLTALGRAAEGAALLRLAHALDPGRAPSASEFSPDALAAHAAAIAATPARRDVELVVPRGATVEVDGRAVAEERGRVRVALTAGPHVLVVRASGWLPMARVLAVDQGAGPLGLDVTTAMSPDPAAVVDEDAALAPGVGGERAGRVVGQVLAHAELDALYLVASVQRGGQPALLGQRCTGARPACTEVLEVGHADVRAQDGAARVLVDRLARAPVRGGVSLPADERLRGGRGGQGAGEARRRWVVAGVGVAAVLAVVTVVVLASGDEPLPVVTVDPGDF